MADHADDSDGDAYDRCTFEDPDALPAIGQPRASVAMAEKGTATPIRPKTPNAHDEKQANEIKALQETVEQLRKEVARLSDVKTEYDGHMVQCKRDKDNNKGKDEKGEKAGAKEASSAALTAEKYKLVKAAVDINEKLHTMALAKAKEKAEAKLAKMEKKKDEEIAELRQVITLMNAK